MLKSIFGQNSDKFVSLIILVFIILMFSFLQIIAQEKNKFHKDGSDTEPGKIYSTQDE